MTGRALLLALFWLLAGTAQSAVVTFQGDALDSFTGLRTDRLEVAAYRDGELRSAVSYTHLTLPTNREV